MRNRHANTLFREKKDALHPARVHKDRELLGDFVLPTKKVSEPAPLQKEQAAESLPWRDFDGIGEDDLWNVRPGVKR